MAHFFRAVLETSLDRIFLIISIEFSLVCPESLPISAGLSHEKPKKCHERYSKEKPNFSERDKESIHGLDRLDRGVQENGEHNFLLTDFELI